MLHDVGKLRVPDRVLLKPGKLDEAEWALIRQHPMWGEQLLMGDDGFALARRIARWHHENWDGSGYPDGLRGERRFHWLRGSSGSSTSSMRCAASARTSRRGRSSGASRSSARCGGPGSSRHSWTSL